MPDEQPLDPLPALVATIDQAMKNAPILAKWAWAMFVAFKDAGFDDEQALRLTMNQMKAGS